MEKNFDRFVECYRRKLKEAVTARPEDYRYAVGQTDEIADRMMAALLRGSVNKDGYAFKQTCKELGIKHTYQAIYAFIKA